MEVSIKDIREAVNYCPKTGVLTWKERPSCHFKDAASASKWNKRFAGKIAGSKSDDGYIRISLFSARFKAHRVAWAIFYGKWPENDIDHIDGDGFNNRIENLRDVPERDNCKNRRASKNNTSGANGVYMLREGRYRAFLIADGERTHLGYFDDLFEAVCARKSAEAKHGGFTARHGQ